MVIAALCMMLCAMLLAGCGKSLIITTGFGRGEVFRIGSEGCRISELKVYLLDLQKDELKVYLLDLQKENEKLFGSAIWEGGDSKELQDAVKEQALSQVTRVKALNQIAVKRNVMLTELEKREAEEAEHKYYAGLSAAEIKYIGLDEANLQRMFREYALADKTWRSLGESAEQTYDEFFEKTQCDLNTKYWQTVDLKKIDGDLAAAGFSASYKAVFGAPQQDDSAQGSTQDSTQAAAQEE